MNAEADGMSALRRGWLQPMRGDWPSAVCRRLERNGVVVRVVVAEVLGSAPREVGACLLLSHDGIEGTIGGGNLEWRAIEVARAGLTSSDTPARVARLTLGKELAQCCGGVVTLWVERFVRADLPLMRRAAAAVNSGTAVRMTSTVTESRVTRVLDRRGDTDAEGALWGDETASLRASGTRGGGARRVLDRVHLTSSDDGRITLVERLDRASTPVWVYGAGHVGQALVRTLADLPFSVTWLDARAELFPHVVPDNVSVLEAPLEAVSTAPRSARHLVMTHDHALDYDLCRAILARNEFAGLGLIGSESKAARFRSRLLRDGLSPDRLVSPIGLTDIPSKLPAAIAIGIAAQLLKAAPSVESIERTLDDCAPSDCASCQRSHR